MRQQHGAQVLHAESVAPLGQGGLRGVRRHSHSAGSLLQQMSLKPTNEISHREIFQDNRRTDLQQPQRQDQREPRAAFHHKTIWMITPLLEDPCVRSRSSRTTSRRRASVMPIHRCVVSCFTTVWSDSVEGAMAGDEAWRVFCRYRCRPLIHELVQRVLGQQHRPPAALAASNGRRQTDRRTTRRNCQCPWLREAPQAAR